MTKKELIAGLRKIVATYEWCREDNEVGANIILRIESLIGERKDDFLSGRSFEVLSYLNKKTGKSLRQVGLIPSCLSNPFLPATVDECKRVIDYLFETWNEDYIDKYLNHTTPFRKDNFDKYLDMATRWKHGEKKHDALGGLIL